MQPRGDPGPPHSYGIGMTSHVCVPHHAWFLLFPHNAYPRVVGAGLRVLASHQTWLTGVTLAHVVPRPRASAREAARGQ